MFNTKKYFSSGFYINSFFVVILLIFWLWLWSNCANPFNTTCFAGSGEGDHLQHYFAWQAFASNKSIQFLRPSFSNWTWPFEVPLIYGDPIPLLAIIAKPLQLLLGKPIQYFSIASLINILTSYAIGNWIGKILYLRRYESCILGFCLSISGLSILRVTGHEALSIQAILLLALAFAVKREASGVKWGVLMFVSLGIHAYFLPMIAPIGIYTIIFSHSEKNHRAAKKVLSQVSPVITISLWVLIGMIFWGYFPSNVEASAGGLFWNANLLALIDSQGLSTLVPGLEINRPYQWEGYSYLGIGWGLVISLSLASVLVEVLFKAKIFKIDNTISAFPIPKLYTLLMGLFFLFAIGEPIFLGTSKITDFNPLIKILGPIASIFRSTGRFMWPLVYSLSIWSFCRIMRLRWRSSVVKHLYIVVLIIFLLESNLVVAKAVNGIFSERITSANSFGKPSLHPRLISEIRDANFFINATGDPWISVEQIPKFSLQNIKAEIKTNYNPYLARSPKLFSEFYRKNPCLVIEETKAKALSETGIDNSILYLIRKADLKSCVISTDKIVAEYQDDNLLIVKNP